MPQESSPAIAALVKALEALPGYGPRSAQRAAFFLLSPKRRGELQALRQALADAETKVHRCPRCRTWCEGAVCEICADPSRDASLLCVVETVQDQMALEKSLNWPGLYFILGGRLSPMDDMGPTEIGFPELLVRIEEGLAENGNCGCDVLHARRGCNSVLSDGRRQEALAAAANYASCKRSAFRAGG